MSLFVVGGVYGLAGGLLLLSMALIFRPVKGSRSRRGWISLAIFQFGLACWLGIRIFLLNSPGSDNNLELASAVGITCLAGLACYGSYWLGKRNLEEHHDQQVLQDELGKYRGAFDASPQILVIKDNQGIYQYTNQAYRAFLGKKEDDLVGAMDSIFFPRAQVNTFRQEEESAIQSNQARSREEEIYGVDGARWFKIARIPITDSSNHVVGLLISGQDISDRRQIENHKKLMTQEMTLLAEAERDLNETAGSTDQWDQILNWAGKLGASEHIGLWTMCPERSISILKSGCGKLEKLAGTQLKAGSDIAWKVWQSGKVEWICNGSSEGQPRTWLHDQGFSAAIGLPLLLRGQVVLVLALYYEQTSLPIVNDGNQALALFAQYLSANLQYDHQVEISQSSMMEAQRQLEDQARLHQAEKEEWRLQLQERITANQSEGEEWRRRLDAAQYRTRLEHVVAVIAAHMISLDHSKIDEAITRSLVTLVKFAGIDRGYLSLFPKEIYLEMGQVTWYGNQPTGAAESFMDPSRTDFAWGLGRLNQLETIHIPRVVELDPEKEDAASFLEAKGIKSFTAVPLVSNRSVIGFLGFESLRVEIEWPAEILALWKVSADMMVNLLERKWAAKALEENQVNINHIISELEQRNREGTLMTEMGDLLQACRTADEAYPIIIRYIQRLLPAGSGALYMIHDPKDPAEMVAAWGEGELTATEHELAGNECWALRRGRIYSVDNPALEPICGHIKSTLKHGYICVPMIAQGVAVGVLHLRLPENGEKPQVFTESHQHLATRIGEYIAIPLTNLKMRDDLRSQAIRDPLTMLYNRRYMEETLEREIRRAMRHSTSVGIIMFDIDRMKPTNDRFGHDAGDLVLRSLGRELLSLFRGEDVACRHGGDEFTVVLPEATLADVWRRAEQMRESIKKLSIRYDGQEVGPLTLSIGVAAFPDHGLTADRVLLASDAASYASKEEGGDRIMMGHKVES